MFACKDRAENKLESRFPLAQIGMVWFVCLSGTVACSVLIHMAAWLLWKIALELVEFGQGSLTQDFPQGFEVRMEHYLVVHQTEWNLEVSAPKKYSGCLVEMVLFACKDLVECKQASHFLDWSWLLCLLSTVVCSALINRAAWLLLLQSELDWAEFEQKLH